MKNESISWSRIKTAEEQNEDRVRIGENFAYVIDGTNGVTDKQVTDRPTNGCWYAEKLDSGLAKRLGDTDRSIKSILSEIISELFDSFEKKVEGSDFELKQSETPSAFLTVARWNDKELEIYTLGDCSAIISRKKGFEWFRESKMVALEKKNLQKLQKMKREEGLNHQEAMDRIVEDYLEVKRRQDVPGGWYSAGFNPKTIEKGRTRSYQLESIDGLMLFTDGLENLIGLKDDLETGKDIYSFIKGKGIEKSLEEMRELEKEDGECKRAPRYKKSDDVSIAIIEDFS